MNEVKERKSLKQLLQIVKKMSSLGENMNGISNDKLNETGVAGEEKELEGNSSPGSSNSGVETTVKEKKIKIVKESELALLRMYAAVDVGREWFRKGLKNFEIEDVYPMAEYEYYKSFELYKAVKKFAECKVERKGKIVGMSAGEFEWFTKRPSFRAYSHGFEREKDEHLLKKREELKKELKRKEKESLSVKAIEDVCKAVDTLMYNAKKESKEEREICVKNLIGWVQWARIGILGEKEVAGREIEPRFLSLYSGRGGTGKSYIVDSLRAFYKENGLITASQDGLSLTGRFTSDDIVMSDLLVAEDLSLNPSNQDINFSKLNLIVDRGVLSQEKKGVDALQKRTNCSMITTTNYMYSHRRLSMITIRERQVIDVEDAPSSDDLKNAWATLFYYCPNVVSYKAMKINDTSEESLKYYYEKILDYFISTGKTSARGHTLAKHCCNDKIPSKRAKRMVLESLGSLVKNGSLKNLTCRTLEIDKYEFDEETYYSFMDELIKKSDENGDFASLSEEVIELYYGDEIIKKEYLRSLDKKKMGEQFVRRLAESLGHPVKPEELEEDEKEMYFKSLERIDGVKKFEEIMERITKKEECNRGDDTSKQ